MALSGTQYRTPGRTVPSEVPSGQSRTGGVGWEGIVENGALQSPPALFMHRGGAIGISIRRSRTGGPAATKPAISTMENTCYVPALQHHTLICQYEPALAIPLILRHEATQCASARLRNCSALKP